jgi:Conserved TM helix
MENFQIGGYVFDSALALQYGKLAGVIALILVVTWALAKAAKWSFAKLVDRVPLLQRAGGDGESVGMSLGKIVSLLIWLFGLIAVLQRLGLDSVIKPIQGLLESVIGYVPNFIGAAIAMFVGYTVAKIVRDLVATTLATVNFDKWANKGGVDLVTGNSKISNTLSTIVFILIIIPVAIIALDILNVPAITEPAKAMLQMVSKSIPLIIGASLLLGFGYVIARWVSGLLTTLLPDLGADRAIAELGVLPAGRSASGIIATVVSVAFMIFFAIAATNMLGFPQLTDILETVLAQAGSVAFGAVLIAFGVIIARLLSNLIGSATGDGLAPTAAYYLTIGLFVFIGIKQMNIGGPIVDYAFGALAIGAAVAFALAFGLGGRDAAARLLADMQKPAAPSAPLKKVVVKSAPATKTTTK